MKLKSLWLLKRYGFKEFLKVLKFFLKEQNKKEKSRKNILCWGKAKNPNFLAFLSKRILS